MVAQQVGRRITADAHRHPLPIGVVVPCHRAGAAAPLEVVADVIGGHAAQRGLGAVAVPVSEQAPYRKHVTVPLTIFVATMAILLPEILNKLLHLPP